MDKSTVIREHMWEDVRMYEIFVDVSVDIDPEFARENHVRYVPMEYMIGEEVHHCNEPESFEELHKYYDRLRDKIPTKTSQITPFQYVEVFEDLVRQKTEILYLSLSGGLSNTYESANLAVRMLSEDYNDAAIEVVDSFGATGGMGLLVESACKNRAAGMSLQENAEWLRANAKKVNYYFKVEDLMYLKRGGRVSAATAIVGTALDIKPILNIDATGHLATVAKKRGRKLAIKYLVDMFRDLSDMSIDNTVYICGSDCVADEEILKKMILEICPEANIRITSLSPIIGAHTGPDMVAVIFYGKERV